MVKNFDQTAKYAQ